MAAAATIRPRLAACSSIGDLSALAGISPGDGPPDSSPSAEETLAQAGDGTFLPLAD